MRTSPVSARVRRRTGGVLVVLIIAAALVAGAPVAADAGPDLRLSKFWGPPGSDVELSSPDLFDMGVDMCPRTDSPDRPYGPSDTFEVRWELGVLEGPARPLGEEGGYRYAQLGDPVAEVVAAGAVGTAPDVLWRTTITVPAGVREGQELVVNASCWRLGDDVPGGEEVYFTYYYLPVFVVTGPDGVLPTSTTVSTTTTSTPAPRPAPSPAAPSAPAAAARPGSASFTG